MLGRMGSKSLATFFLVALAAAWFSGCQRSEVSGRTEWMDRGAVREGDVAPTVAVKTADGKQTTLGKITPPIYIVAFVPAEGDCGKAKPDLRTLAADLDVEGVSVVQIAEGCPKCPDLVEKTRTRQDNLLVFCDGQKSPAWQAYGKPKIGSVYLVNSDGRIAMVTMSGGDFSKIREKASRLGDALEERDREKLQ